MEELPFISGELPPYQGGPHSALLSYQTRGLRLQDPVEVHRRLSQWQDSVRLERFRKVGVINYSGVSSIRLSHRMAAVPHTALHFRYADVGLLKYRAFGTWQGHNQPPQGFS